MQKTNLKLKAPLALSKDEALKLAMSALKSWGNYGQEMRALGRGADCSREVTGYSNDYLISMIQLTIDQGH